MNRQYGKSKPPVIVTPVVKYIKTLDDSTVVRTLGVPYAGPDYLDHKDLQGEYFSKDTDFGFITVAGNREPVISRGHSFYDHAWHDVFGKEPIGVSKFLKETEAGQWWDIEIERSYRYHDFLLQLAQKGILGASSQPIQSSVEIDGDTGFIKRWHTAEISLTPSPANPLAIVELARSMDLDDYAGSVEKMLNAESRKYFLFPVKSVDVPLLEEEKPDEDVPDENEVENEAPTSFVDEIDKIFETEEEPPVENEPEVVPPTEEPETEEEDTQASDLQELMYRMDALEHQISTIRETSEAQIKTLTNNISELKLGVKAIGINVKKQLINMSPITSLVHDSDEELVSKFNTSKPDSDNFSSPAIPSNAPGRN